ncbi:MAG TPA: hypothetical protein P5160_07735, partial [Candidatus Omnitrophota bacterium]|nr:hypothetical protein [Candidatus Omnitrophota bacterium]
IPIVTSFVAIFVILSFDISENKAYDIRKQVEERRKEDRRKAERRNEERRAEERRRTDRREQ